MRRFLKTGAALSIAGATLALAACGGHGPNSYLMPKDALLAKLTGAEREYSLGGRDKRTIRATSRSGDTINVRLTYSAGSLGTANCKVRVEAIDEKWTRATPECPTSSSATERTQHEIDQMQIDEFVLAVLYDRDVDTSMVLKRTSAVVIDNFGDVTKEVGDEMQALAPEVPTSDSGWAESSDSDWGS